MFLRQSEKVADRACTLGLQVPNVELDNERIPLVGPREKLADRNEGAAAAVPWVATTTS